MRLAQSASLLVAFYLLARLRRSTPSARGPSQPGKQIEQIGRAHV